MNKHRFILKAVHVNFHFRIPYTVVLLCIGGLYGQKSPQPPCVIRCPVFLTARLCPYPGGLAFEQWNKSNGATKEEATVSLVQWSNIHPELIFYGRSTTRTFPDLETCAVLSASGPLHDICTCTLIA